MSQSENEDTSYVLITKIPYVDDNDFDTCVEQRQTSSKTGPIHEQSRETWAKKSDFILSCVGLAVGLGNIWRFPYLCYKNGGGAFLIPYGIFLVFGGIPLFMLEISLGQYMSLSGHRAWNICPLFHGIGISNVVTCFFMNIYYILVLAWSAYYLCMSFTSVLPWSSCNNWWNTPRCSMEGEGITNATCNSSVCELSQVNWTTEKPVDPAVEFWERGVLQLTSDITKGGGIIWELALSLLIVWIVVYFCVWKGVKWTGKVVYFTATFPYVILFALLVRGLTLDGAADGLLFYLKPDLSRLTDIQVWIDGGTQVFFSYAVAIGATITLGSYNKFSNNFYKDCFLISCINTGTSLVGGLAVFSVLGFMAKQHNIPISEVADAGPGLVFVVYPKAVTQMYISPLWAVLFFFMIILLGLDSQFVGVEAVITPLVDFFPKYLLGKKHRMVFVAVYCVVSYCVGLSMVSRGGMFIFQLFDYYSASGIVLLWTSFLETVAIAWVFGVDYFYDAIEMMLGYRISPYLQICWKYLTPLLSLGLFITELVLFRPLTYNKSYQYPSWAQAFGIALALSAMLCVPVCGVAKLVSASGSLSKRWEKVTSPILERHQIHPNWERQNWKAKNEICL
ncbi:sodium- and chloride-dependent creatine transporter 1-like [Argopecten irradians]|uniref:sodium- and chloride-dependent creatine transporter 1-like n=1 Tax=Argopecten irradians TaxID=31199 RepID=UPI00371D1BCD